MLPAHGIKTPKTYQEAITGPQAKKWFVALKGKVSNQHKKVTFKITKLPHDERATPGKRDFRIKKNPDWTMACYKARFHFTGILPPTPDIRNWKMRYKEEIADGFTKPLGLIAFEKFVELLGLTSVAGTAQGLKE